MGVAPFPPLACAVLRRQVRVTTPPRPTGGPLFAANPRCRSPWPGRPGTATAGALPTERLRRGTGRIRPRALLQVPCHIPSRPSTLDVPRLPSGSVKPLPVSSEHLPTVGGLPPRRFHRVVLRRQFRQRARAHLAACADRRPTPWTRNARNSMGLVRRRPSGRRVALTTKQDACQRKGLAHAMAVYEKLGLDWWKLLGGIGRRRGESRLVRRESALPPEGRSGADRR